MENNLAVFGSPIDKGAFDQIVALMHDERAVRGALMADHHLGYSMPIGGVIAYQDAVSPSGVGYDIACGNMAVKTNINVFALGAGVNSVHGKIMPDYNTVKNIMREIQRTVAFGMGRNNPVPVDHELFDDDLWTWIDAELPKGLKDKARDQLGTVGSGNHYVDLLVDTTGHIWIANHFGSRGLGHTIATAFFAANKGLPFSERVGEVAEEATIFDTNSYLGEQYLQCMDLAGRYAYAGREFVIQQVLNILGAQATWTVHNHHNFAWFENGLWVVRKGATPLTAEPAYIGGSMGDASFIVSGVTPRLQGTVSGNLRDLGEVQDLGNIGSAPHGAGRIMSRTKAAGKVRKMWVCPNRNCSFEPIRSTSGESGHPSNHCPLCKIPLRRERVRDTTDALIDWDAVRADLKAQGIVVLGAGADEAPGVYKRLEEVLAAHSNIEILERLDPIGVVMAGPDERDDYKD